MINNPINNINYSIYSPQGKLILKKYIQNFLIQNGGVTTKKPISTRRRRRRKRWNPKKKKKYTVKKPKTPKAMSEKINGTVQISIGIPLRFIPTLYLHSSEISNITSKKDKQDSEMLQNVVAIIKEGYFTKDDQRNFPDAFGLAILVNAYITLFTVIDNIKNISFDDRNTGLKGLPFYMSRNKFNELFEAMDVENQNRFEDFVEDVIRKHEGEDPMENNKNLGWRNMYMYPSEKSRTLFYIHTCDWLRTILNPDIEHDTDRIYKIFVSDNKEGYEEIIHTIPQGTKIKEGVLDLINKIRQKEFSIYEELEIIEENDGDLMSPPPLYWDFETNRDELYSMGALSVVRNKYNTPNVIFECRSCSGNKPVNLQKFQKNANKFINWLKDISGNIADSITIGFEYELSKYIPNTLLPDDENNEMLTLETNTTNDIKDTNHVKWDFALNRNPRLAHEFVSKPFNLVNSYNNLIEFINQIKIFINKKKTEEITNEEMDEEDQEDLFY